MHFATSRYCRKPQTINARWSTKLAKQSDAQQQTLSVNAISTRRRNNCNSERDLASANNRKQINVSPDQRPPTSDDQSNSRTRPHRLGTALAGAAAAFNWTPPNNGKTTRNKDHAHGNQCTNFTENPCSLQPSPHHHSCSTARCSIVAKRIKNTATSATT